jgi:hypothetical protein
MRKNANSSHRCQGCASDPLGLCVNQATVLLFSRRNQPWNLSHPSSEKQYRHRWQMSGRCERSSFVPLPPYVATAIETTACKYAIPRQRESLPNAAIWTAHVAPSSLRRPPSLGPSSTWLTFHDRSWPARKEELSRFTAQGTYTHNTTATVSFNGFQSYQS